MRFGSKLINIKRLYRNTATISKFIASSYISPKPYSQENCIIPHWRFSSQTRFVLFDPPGQWAEWTSTDCQTLLAWLTTFSIWVIRVGLSRHFALWRFLTSATHEHSSVYISWWMYNEHIFAVWRTFIKNIFQTRVGPENINGASLYA